MYVVDLPISNTRRQLIGWFCRLESRVISYWIHAFPANIKSAPNGKLIETKPMREYILRLPNLSFKSQWAFFRIPSADEPTSSQR